MASVYASTTREWFDVVSSIPGDGHVAFWQPTAANPRRIAPGERWYFKQLGKPIVLGYGHFVRWESMTAAELFARYGIATGYPSLRELVIALQVFTSASSASLVGNVVLNRIQSFRPPEPLGALGLDDLSVRFVYLDDPDPIAARLRLDGQPLAPAISVGAPPSTGTTPFGPTTGPAPSDWSASIGQSSDAPAFVYALRFGHHDIWKIGWAVDIRKRLRSINDHIPSELIPEKWECIFHHAASTKKSAYALEQLVLKRLHKYRTKGERLRCETSDLQTAWLDVMATAVGK